MATTITTKPTERPQRYLIAALLNSGVQPFEDLDPEALAALGKGIGRAELVVPIVLTSDGILIDGHQRLKAMAAQGRKYIDAADVRIAESATATDALEWSVRLNVQRRHLSVAEKAEIARRLQHERRWSQAKIAKLFGVSRPAVSQWLADDTDRPTTVVGVDGIEQPARKPRPRPKATPTPWDIYSGPMFIAVEKLTALLRAEENSPHHPALTESEHDRAIATLEKLAAVIDELLSPPS